MEGEKNKNSPLQSTCFIIYNGKLNPPVVFRFLNEKFQSITLTQYHRGFWLFSLSIDPNAEENIEFHISQPCRPTKFYIFYSKMLSSFKFIDITQSEELVPFPEFNSFFTSAIFNHKINFTFGSSNQLEDINKFLLSFINYKNDQPLIKNTSTNANNQTENLSNKNQENNTENNKEIDDTKNNKNQNKFINSSFHFSQDYNNNGYDKNDEYLIWALLYISCQPWYSLFQYNESFSEFLLKYVTQFIMKNFFLNKTENDELDFKKCPKNLDTNFNVDFDFDFSVNKKKLSSYRKFKSAQPFVDTLILLIRAQLGEGIAYIVSCIFSNREEEERRITYSDLRFTLTSSVSSISSSMSVPSSAISAEGNHIFKKRSSSFELRQTNDQINFQYSPSLFDNKTNHEHEDFILSELSKMVKDDEDSENLFLVYFAIATKKNKFAFKPPKLLDDEKIAKIICERLLFTTRTIESAELETDFNYFLSLIPNINEVIVLLSQGKYFIPFEWLTLFKKSPLFVNDAHFISLVQNSLRNSCSKHLLNSYAKVTDSGALLHDNSDLSNRVLQPGSILQPDVSCGKFSMMMAGSVALSGSFLIQNCYSPRNAIVLPMEGHGSSKAIDSTAELESPVKLKRGVTIGKNSFISKNVKIGSGTKIGENVYVSENVRIHKGCLIENNEMVPHDFEIPIGFIFNENVVEFAKKLPRVIRRTNNSLFFYKQKNGFVDLKEVLNVSDSTAFILDYFETFKEFPAECGRQIAINLDDSSLKKIDERDLYGIFKLHSLLVSFQFWKTLDKQTNENESKKANENTNTNANENANEDKNTNSNLSENTNENENANANENTSSNLSENTNTNENTNSNLSENTNANENTSSNLSENTNTNENTNFNLSENANENENKNSNLNENANTNENTNSNLNENANENKNSNLSENANKNSNLSENKNESINSNVSLDEKTKSVENKGELLNDEQKEDIETVMFNLANLAFDELIDESTSNQLLAIDDFLEDETVTIFVLKLAQNLSYFEEKSLSSEKISKAKKVIFELVDEVIVRMSLFASAERKRTFQMLKTIIELTHKKNEA